MKKLKVIFGVLVLCFGILGTFSISSTSQAAKKDFALKEVNKTEMWTNGKIGYYMEHNIFYSTIYKVDIKKEKTSVLKKFKNKRERRLSIGTVYGNKIYLNKLYYAEEDELERGLVDTHTVYSLDVKTKKMKKEISDIRIETGKGEYFVGAVDPNLDIAFDANEIFLAKFTSKGYKVIKTLTTRGQSCDFYRGRLYYASFPEKNFKKLGKSKMTMKSINMKGRDVKTYFTYDSKDDADPLSPLKVSKKGIKFLALDDEKEYFYSFKTKKITRIK